ncbi:hypothetical protein [Chromobacterium sp. IIBBL 290-4]|uniref:hypothetical protein n=1 Tax=Chromobacterium sp. IIBBL 290-4 TaxID=2953890 RepID=UPI0020B88EAB|nr:hypothetical protein [Chromobacterium sp. IIBBL 290-4]UTH73744.1 hypothetical protein NKT35_19705 [Chromobacterium sp. IIBBL 290-4]
MDAKLIEVLAELARKLDGMGAQVPVDKVLWSPAMCAKYLGVSERHFSERLSLQRGFPEAFNVAAGEKRMDLRWKAKDIMSWVERKRVRRAA